MKKRIYATMMALLLSAAMLAGCGDTSKEDDRSSRSKNNQSYEEKDDRDSSKKDRDKDNSSSAAGKKQDQENSSNNSEDEQKQGNTSNVSEDEQKQENTPNVAENDQSQTNTPASNSAEAYADDLKALFTLFAVQDISDDDPEKMLSELQTMIDGMNVKTSEALVIKSDLQELVNILNSLVTVLNSMNDPDALADLDLNILNDAFVQIEELSEAIEDHTEAFINAAEASGMDEDTLKELEELATSLGLF